jgi:hypothetical protein
MTLLWFVQPVIYKLNRRLVFWHVSIISLENQIKVLIKKLIKLCATGFYIVCK